MKLKAIQTLLDPSGLYVLTSKGALGVYLGLYSEEKRFSLDAELSAEFSEHTAYFLKAYLANPDEAHGRVAIVYSSSEKKPWGHAAIFMEEFVVRDLYPVSGTINDELTMFQKRNRERSIYRGMEALLGHKSNSNLAIYCPVLFDRHTTLDHYLPMLGREAHEDDRITPVFEVLNLVANIPILARNTPAIFELREKLHAVLIKSHMRKDSSLALAENLTWPSPSMASTPTPLTRDRPSTVFPAHHAPASPVPRPAPGTVTMDFSKLHVTDRHEHIDSFQEQPPRPIDPMTLQEFAPFRAVNNYQLVRIATQCLIHHAPAGTRLLERGMNDKWNLLLINGTLLLEPQDGALLTIEGKTEKAANPVSSLKPRKYNVVAKTPVTFLWVHDALLQLLAPGGPV